MRKSFRTVALVVVLFCWGLSGGVAAADPPNLEDVTDQFKDTPDGWRLHVSLYNMTITSVPNMAATAFSREAFVSATAEVWVEALHPEERTPEGSKVTQRSISLWLQQGCQANLSTTTLSDNGTSGGGLSATTGTDANGASTGTATSPNVTGNNNPSIQQTVQPGTIAEENPAEQGLPRPKIRQRCIAKASWTTMGGAGLVERQADGCGAQLGLESRLVRRAGVLPIHRRGDDEHSSFRGQRGRIQCYCSGLIPMGKHSRSVWIEGLSIMITGANTSAELLTGWRPAYAHGPGRRRAFRCARTGSERCCAPGHRARIRWRLLQVVHRKSRPGFGCVLR